MKNREINPLYGLLVGKIKNYNSDLRASPGGEIPAPHIVRTGKNYIDFDILTDPRQVEAVGTIVEAMSYAGLCNVHRLVAKNGVEFWRLKLLPDYAKVAIKNT